MHDVYIEVYCPNIPKLEDLEVHIPQLFISNFRQFDLKETVKVVCILFLIFILTCKYVLLI